MASELEVVVKMSNIMLDNSGKTDSRVVDNLSNPAKKMSVLEDQLKEAKQELAEMSLTLKLSASSLENQRLQLDTILDNTLAGIFVVQGNLSIVRANRAARNMFGITDGKLNILELFSDQDEARRIIVPLMAEHSNCHALRETVGRTREGCEFPIEFGLATMDHLGWDQSVWIFSDITERKHIDARRHALEQELVQARKLEALGTLASGVAHEINTPVQYISDNVRFLDESLADIFSLIKLYRQGLGLEKSSIDQPKIVSTIRDLEKELDIDFLHEEMPQAISQSLEGIEQVASIANAIKEFSHPGGDEKNDVDINKLINTTLTVTHNQWKFVATTHLELDENLPMVPCISGEICQVIMNMIVNAVDAMEMTRTGGQGIISIKTRTAGDFVEIVFSDNGPGIPVKCLDRVFDPFFTTKDIGKGTGQGLAITHTIIHQHHDGQVSCKNGANGGAEFLIQLPIHQSENQGAER